MGCDYNMPTYRCKRCNYIYVDEEQGAAFEEISDDYRCPKCRYSKNIFIKKVIHGKD